MSANHDHDELDELGDLEFEPVSLAFLDNVPGCVLMLHGFPLTSQIWDGQLEAFEGEARIVAPDLRGSGHTDAPEGPYSMGMLADDCVYLLDMLGIEQAVIAGHSLGGYVALELYRRHPEYVSGLVLVSTRAGADSEEGRAGRDATAAKVGAEGIGAVAGMREKLLAPSTYKDDPDLIGMVDAIMAEATPTGVIGALAAMRDRIDSTPHLAEIDVPTLIIHGADDTLIPPSEAEAMHQAIAGSTLEIIHGAGHLPMLENEEAFNEALRQFLEQISPEI